MEKLSIVRLLLILSVALLELSIPGPMFAFIDDQEIRSQVNKNLWKISASVAQLYKKTKGRKRKKLDTRVRKFHVFSGQTKSQEEYQKEINQLQGRREGGQGEQNTRGPECSEGPGNLGKMFVLFIIALCLS